MANKGKQAQAAARVNNPAPTVEQINADKITLVSKKHLQPLYFSQN